jgi:outer membrane protein assembly factor BamB
MKPKSFLFIPFVLGYSVLATVAVQAGDWPQILGPHRNGVADNEHIAGSWPADGPKTIWQREVGTGFAGVSVSKGSAILFHRVGDEEIVTALDAHTGKQLWKSPFPATYEPGFIEDNGPRAIPVIAGDRIYAYNAAGVLRCLEFTTGKLRWKRDTFADFNSKKDFHGEPAQGYFGMTSSPLVEGNKILLNVGGDTKDCGIAAFAAETGETVWKATSERASYSSPVAVTVDGVRHVIFVTRLNIVSLNPDNGKERFRLPFGRLGPTVNAANPVVFEGQLFVTASYGIGALLAKIKPDRADVLWRDPEIMASQYATCVESEGILYGVEGRQDGPPADLRCFDTKTRKVLWTQPGFGYATLLRAGNRLLILTTDGTLVLAAANPQKYEELARRQISETTVRALPALADGLLYVRDSKLLKCIDLRPK